MGRMMFGLALGLMVAQPVWGQCPGSLGIGLTVLFGSDLPVNRMRGGGFEESDARPPTKAEMAQECLKVWRQLIADSRFDVAPAVAAKALELDPTNLDAQHAVAVSSALSRPTEIERDPRAEAALNYLYPRGLFAGVGEEKGPETCPLRGGRAMPARLSDAVVPVAAEVVVPISTRVKISVGRWMCECDRATTANDREMILEGDVTIAIRGGGVSMQAPRVHVDLSAGTVRLEGK